MRYFAYGCLMDLEQLAGLCPTARRIGPGTLPEHRLAFPRRCREWGGGVAGVLHHPGSVVQGVLYEVDEAGMGALDVYEEVQLGAYRRERVTVLDPAGDRSAAWVYVAEPEPGGPFDPPAAYRDALVRGLEAVQAPADYIDALRRLRCHEPA